MAKLKVQKGRGKDRQEKREKNERGLGSSGSSGSQAINISCRAGKAGLTIFRRRRRLALSQPLTVAGPNYQSPRVQIRCEFRGYRCSKLGTREHGSGYDKHRNYKAIRVEHQWVSLVDSTLNISTFH